MWKKELTRGQFYQIDLHKLYKIEVTKIGLKTFSHYEEFNKFFTIFYENDIESVYFLLNGRKIVLSYESNLFRKNYYKISHYCTK